MSGIPLRRRDYAKLDTVGIDVVEAEISRPGGSLSAIADRFGVSEFNARMWRRVRRTELFLLDITPEDILEEVAGGENLASIARKHDISHGLLAKWADTHIDREAMAAARDLAADAQFDETKAALDDARNETDVRREIAKHNVDRFVAERTTRKFTDEKQLRVTGTEGVEFSISYKRRERAPEAQPTGEESAA